jgi:hypothetical protein
MGWRGTSQERRMTDSQDSATRKELSSTETGRLLTQILETSRALREVPAWLDSLAAVSEVEGDHDAA